jgi:hypothetical protein
MVSALIARPRRERAFIGNPESHGFLEAKQLPTDGFVTSAAAADLPNTHDGVVLVCKSDCVHFYDARVPVIPDFQALPKPQRFTRRMCLHQGTPSGLRVGNVNIVARLSRNALMYLPRVTAVRIERPTGASSLMQNRLFDDLRVKSSTSIEGGV